MPQADPAELYEALQTLWGLGCGPPRPQVKALTPEVPAFEDGNVGS